MSLKGLLRGAEIPHLHTKLVTSPRLFEIVQVDEEYSWRLTPYHHLDIANEGICPGQSCRANVNLTLHKPTNESITFWNHVSLNSFVSKPVFLVKSSKLYTSGFGIKFWQWIDSPSEHREKSTIIEQRLIERVLIVFVNYTEVQVISDSRNDVTQLCHDLGCQPNLNSRKQFSSIAVKYINNDVFPELISYWSSYNIDSTKGLTSKVQVIRLDSIMSNLLHRDF